MPTSGLARYDFCKGDGASSFDNPSSFVLDLDDVSFADGRAKQPRRAESREKESPPGEQHW